jgi:hypothetical protein
MFRRDLRRALEWAGIKVRPELFDDSNPAASKPIRIHDLRAGGITWRHARGDVPAHIRQDVRARRRADQRDLHPSPSGASARGALPEASREAPARCQGLRPDCAQGA